MGLWGERFGDGQLGIGAGRNHGGTWLEATLRPIDLHGDAIWLVATAAELQT